MNISIYQLVFLLYSVAFAIFLIIFAPSKLFRIFTGILCTIQITFSYFDYAYYNFPFFHPLVYFYFQTVWFLYFGIGAYTKLFRSLPYKLFISIPACFYTATTWLGLIYLLLRLIYDTDYYILGSAVICSMGVFQSLINLNFAEDVHINLKDKLSFPIISRLDSSKPPADFKSKLTIFQLTDTHIGSFTSVERLRELCEKIVIINPDLVFLTGDFYTMETRNDDLALSEALEPLKQLKGKVFACLGNHDYEEQLLNIIETLEKNDVVLLRDQQTIVSTREGDVQILGIEYHFQDTKEKVQEVFFKNKREVDVKLHITLLHNPMHFEFINDGETDVVFSGHLHGGQIGLLAFGINITLLRVINLFKKQAFLIDNGLWGLNSNRVYSHRGTGHYGFPLRLGVPSEESLIHLYFS